MENKIYCKWCAQEFDGDDDDEEKGEDCPYRHFEAPHELYDGEKPETEEDVCAFIDKGYNFFFVPEELRTEKVCLYAVQKQPLALEYVPEGLKTLELCLIAVQESYSAIDHVPEELKAQVKASIGTEFHIKSFDEWEQEVISQWKKTHRNYEKWLSIGSWYGDIQTKGNYSLACVPENERTPEMCFVAIHYWGAALKWVPDKYKTYELCLDAVRHNTPVDEGCSALAFVPEELKTYELCLEAVRHDYLISIFWENGCSVEFDYAAAINFVPPKLRTPELCFEAFMHHPYSPPGYFNFVDALSDDNGPITVVAVTPESISDILNSSELFIKVLKRMGMPDEYNEDALQYFEKKKKDYRDSGHNDGRKTKP
jgi:hypothetical protein